MIVIINCTLGVRPSEVLLTSNLNEGNIAYDAETIIFTCTIRGNGTILTWTSAEYIGRGGDVLEFSSIDSSGQTTSSSDNPTTIATLINTNTDPDTQVTMIKSELHIIASVRHPTSSVGCRINSHGKANITEFETVPSKKIIPITSYIKLTVTF